MFHAYIYYFPLLGSISNSTSYFMIKCGTAILAAFSEPLSAVYAAVANMAFVAYRARSDPIVLTIPYPPY